MVKKFLFSAIALIGFTVASYGANTVEIVNLTAEEKEEVIEKKRRRTRREKNGRAAEG